MLHFTDISFWLVFVVFLTGYAFVRSCSRAGMLLYVTGCSLLFFWMANSWTFWLLPAMAIVTWWTGRVLGDSLCATVTSGLGMLHRILLAFAIVLLLLPLVYFKYSGLLLTSVNEICSTHFSLRSVVLPVGISFFTFQAISYLVDVYRGRFRERVSILEFLFYLSFFPLLLAGPITRAHTFFPQLRDRRVVPSHRLYVGVWLVMLGLLKKCVIADYIAQYNDWVFDDPASFSGLECMLGILGYSVQIYCDFSGYSDMSIGIAAMMGFRLADNFAFPYRATNLSQFWRRWHISLSTWFRDYLYIPLGGSRCSLARTYINNVLTMLVAGLWHGASWMFVLWGGIHGLGLIVQKAFSAIVRHLCQGIATPVLPRDSFSQLPLLAREVSVMLTFCFVSVAWVFFRSDNLHSAIFILHRSFCELDIAYLSPVFLARPWWCACVLIPLLTHLVGERHYNRLLARYVRSPWIVKLFLLLIVFQLVLQFRTANVQPFIYYQF